MKMKDKKPLCLDEGVFPTPTHAAPLERYYLQKRRFFDQSRVQPCRRQRRDPWDVRAVGFPGAPSGKLTWPTSSTNNSPEMYKNQNVLICNKPWIGINILLFVELLPVLGAMSWNSTNIGVAGIFDARCLPSLSRNWVDSNQQVPSLGWETFGRSRRLPSPSFLDRHIIWGILNILGERCGCVGDGPGGGVNF